jgi:peptidoglycan/LPS O-acetylase OafA/YrhL
MVFTTRRLSTTASDFLSRRITRIVPTYWLVTLVTFTLLVLGLKPIGNHEVDVGYLLSSLLYRRSGAVADRFRCSQSAGY